MLALKELAVARKTRISKIDTSHKAKFAQYLTPVEIASFMAELSVRHWEHSDKVSVLDPGAGSGILSCCLVHELHKKNPALNIALDAWEMDTTIIPELTRTYQGIDYSHLRYNIHQEDFITDISHVISWNVSDKYDFVIMNPPYKKINSDSSYRTSLRDLGIETVNTYSAFIALAIKLLSDNGILTAIVPRSFCNGLYFLPFRKILLANTSIVHIHSFETRDDAFGDENVLQENIIITLKKNAEKQEVVTVSRSKGKSFLGYIEKQIPYTEIVSPKDAQAYISIPTSAISVPQKILAYSNTDIGFDVSTGPVVDFRMKDKLIFNKPDNGIPLLYSVNIRNHKITWPALSKKPDSISLDDVALKKLAFQKGYYVLVKRFSSKEEKRRIYATLLAPNSLPSDYFTVENHLNIIHCKNNGLDKHIASGLTAWLNTSYCDNLFRNFSGHTQVNATDLRNMKYPSVNLLVEFGQAVLGRTIEEYDNVFNVMATKYA